MSELKQSPQKTTSKGDSDYEEPIRTREGYQDKEDTKGEKSKYGMAAGAAAGGAGLAGAGAYGASKMGDSKEDSKMGDESS